MRVITIIIIFSIAANAAYCRETIDTLRLCVRYYSEYKYTEEQKEKFDDINILEIGKHSSKFYSLRYQLFSHKRDSIRNSAADSFEYLKFAGEQYGSPKGREYSVYKHIPRKGMLSYSDILYYDHHFQYQEPMPKQKWQIIDGDTTILGYSCRKAVCKFRGRVWTAWYTKEIPIDNGPWKLGGLPGLIIAANEKQGVFSFIATGIEKANSVKTITFDNKKHTQTTPLKLQQLIQDYWKDQWNTINRLEGLEYSEPPKAQRTFTACLLEYFQ